MNHTFSKPERLLVFAAGLALSLAACAQILGIEDRPLRPDGGAPVDEAGLDGAPDRNEAAACVMDESAGCAAQCVRHDFCDDFDQPGESPGSRWLLSALSNPLVRGDAGFDLPHEGGRSAPAYAAAHAFTDQNAAAVALLLHEMNFNDTHSGTSFNGVRAAADVRVEAATAFDAGLATDASADAGVAFVPMFALVTNPPLPTPAAVAVGVNAQGVVLAASPNILDESAPRITKYVYETQFIQAFGNWVRVELLVAPPQAAIAKGFSSCSSVSTELAAAASVAGAFQTCIALDGALGNAAWARTPIVGAGLVVPQYAMLRVGFDNVVADFLR